MVSSTQKGAPPPRRFLFGPRGSRGSGAGGGGGVAGSSGSSPPCFFFCFFMGSQPRGHVAWATAVLLLAAALLLLSFQLTPPPSVADMSSLRASSSLDDEHDDVLSSGGDITLLEIRKSQSRSLAALERIEALFPKEVVAMVAERAGEHSLPDLQSLPREDPPHIALEKLGQRQRQSGAHVVLEEDPLAKLGAASVERYSLIAQATAKGEDPDALNAMEALLRADPKDPTRRIQRENRIRRREKRLRDLIWAAQHEGSSPADDDPGGGGDGANSSGKGGSSAGGGGGANRAGGGAGRGKGAGGGDSGDSRRREEERERERGSAQSEQQLQQLQQQQQQQQQQLIRLMRDQVIMARAYSGLAQNGGHDELAEELRECTHESARVLRSAEFDSADLSANVVERMRAMGQALANAREKLYECDAMVKTLRAMVHRAEDEAEGLKQQSMFLSQLAARTVPRGIVCLTMRLTLEYAALMALPPDERPWEVLARSYRDRLRDPRLHHYALFSDNVLATSVVVNSAVTNANNSAVHVFHVVTDKLNYGAMKTWFALNPPRQAALEVLNIDDFHWLNASYCPVLRQLESAAMKEYYFRLEQQQARNADSTRNSAAGSSSSSGGGSSNGASNGGSGTTALLSNSGAAANLKYRNPKYLSMLNHLRFYLPEVFPYLQKILFLDDDIVVQKDLTALWKVNLHGNVNGAVETCGASFHRFDKYLNFSNPIIASNFDPQACGWAYGMNMFDLVEWKKRDITGIYHHWQSLNEDRTLWKLGTLPPGLITFYNKTYALDKRWHVLGLGYNPNLDMDEVHTAAVVHYNGNMKPWLEIAMGKFRHLWLKYLDANHPFLQDCNIVGGNGDAL